MGNLLIPNKERKLVIKGIETMKDQNVTKLVRNMVAGWKDDLIGSDLISNVIRNPNNAEEVGKANLYVTAMNADAFKTLLRGATKYTTESKDIKW
jgi:hypothetical protein